MAERSDVLARLDIPSLLKELLPDARCSGENYLIARCPWGERHKNNDASPSFLAFPRDGDFKCQACGERGSIFDLYGKIRGLDYHGSITELARRVGLDEEASRRESTRHKITGAYLYHDESGYCLYWKERVEPGFNGKKKEFYFFHGESCAPGTAFFLPKGKKQTGRGCDPILYNLFAVIASSRVYVTEGEKHADLLTDWNLTATTLDSGSGSTLSDDMIEQLRGKEIIILPDNDQPGHAYAERIASSLQKVAVWIKIVNLPGLPEGGDIIDWAFNEGNDAMRLHEIVESTDYWTGCGEDNLQIEKRSEAVVDHSISDQEPRAFPKLYFDFARHFNDTRRYHFKKGHTAFFDALIMRIAKSSGVRLPQNPSAIAHELETDEATVCELLDIAVRHGMLHLKDGYLSSPMVTEQYNNAIRMCQINATNGARGGKAKSGNSRNRKRKSPA